MLMLCLDVQGSSAVIGEDLFVCKRSKSDLNLYRVNLNTGEEIGILDDDTKKQIGSIQDIIVSPDRKKLGLLCPIEIPGGTKTRIALFDIEANNLKILVDNERYNTCPSFSPDWRYIAFYSSEVGIWERNWDVGKAKGNALMVVDIETSEIKELAPENYILHQPAPPSWSPDGEKLVFTASFDDFRKQHVYKVDLETKKITCLTIDRGRAFENYSPVWLIDNKIYWSTWRIEHNTPSQSGIYVMEHDGSNKRLLRRTNTIVNPIHPNPDKKFMLFKDVRKEDFMGYSIVINLKGEDVTTQTLSQIYSTTWRY